MSNTIYIGLQRNVEPPKKGGYLLIDDEVPKLGDWKRPIYFDPLKHSFNPLQNLDYRKARLLADIFYTISPQGENTLTVRNGKRELLKALLKADRLDKLDGDEEVQEMMADLLLSPVLKGMLCGGQTFTFRPKSPILAKVNRAELGEFDALVIGLLLIAEYGGQVVVPDLGFYGRDMHRNLIREKRLIAGVNFLDELPEKLRQAVLLIDDKIAQGSTVKDAETLAQYAMLQKGTVGHGDYVHDAIEQRGSRPSSPA